MNSKTSGGRIEQRALLRDEQAPLGATVVVRGGSDTRVKLRRHVERTGRAWSLDGRPLLGISVFAVLDMPLEELLRQRFANFQKHLSSDGRSSSQVQVRLAANGPAAPFHYPAAPWFR
jgi:hypothetical protein